MSNSNQLITWTSELELGIEKFDNHHKHLVGIINRLDLVLHTQDKRQDALSTILRELLDYTMFHFKAEEVYMRSIGFPEVLAHKALHKDLIDQLQYKVDLFLQNRSIEISLMAFLHKWLLNHIAIEDHTYAKYAIENKFI